MGASVAVRAWYFPRSYHPWEEKSFVTFGENTGQKVPFTTKIASTNAVPPLEFTAMNIYHARDGKPGDGYPWLENVKLIEPYRNTTLTVTNPREGFRYSWEVRDGSRAEKPYLVASGEETVVSLSRLELNLLSLEEIDSEGMVARRLDEAVMVKYVRREIRTLTEAERTELLDAVREPENSWASHLGGGCRIDPRRAHNQGMRWFVLHVRTREAHEFRS